MTLINRKLTVAEDPLIDAISLFETDPIRIIPESNTTAKLSLTVQKNAVDGNPIVVIEISNEVDEVYPTIIPPTASFDSLFYESIGGNLVVQEFTIDKEYASILPRQNVGDVSAGFSSFDYEWLRVRSVSIGTPPATTGTFTISIRISSTMI